MTTPAPKTRDLLGMIVILCTGVALLVLAIDLNIKRDLLRIGNRAHDDLLLARALVKKVMDGHVEVVGGVPERSDLRTDLDGSVPGGDVGIPASEVEADPVAQTAGRPVRKTAPRANPRRVKRDGPAGPAGVPASGE